MRHLPFKEALVLQETLPQMLQDSQKVLFRAYHVAIRLPIEAVSSHPRVLYLDANSIKPRYFGINYLANNVCFTCLAHG